MNKQFNRAVQHIATVVCPRGWVVGCEGDYDGVPRVPFDVEPGLFEDQETAYAFEAWRLATHWAHDLGYSDDQQNRAVGIMAREVVQLYGSSEQTAEFVATLFAESFGGQPTHHIGAARRFMRFAARWDERQAGDFVEVYGRAEIV